MKPRQAIFELASRQIPYKETATVSGTLLKRLLPIGLEVFGTDGVTEAGLAKIIESH